MRFCSKFVHDINFEERALQPCCNVHNSIVPKFPFNGYKINMDVYTHYIEKVIDEVQMNSPHVCNGCPELVDVPHYNGIKKITFSTLSLNHHRHLCDCRCVYCDLWKPGRHPRPFAILPPIMSLHDQGALQKNCFISWGGGESTLLPDFVSASHWIYEHGYPQYIHTNALRHSAWIGDLLASGQGRLNVSLDSGSATGYARVKGGDWWEKVVASLEKYFAMAKTPEQIDIKYIVFEQNNKIIEIERFFNFCRHLGVRSVQFSFDFEEVNEGMVSEQSILGAAYFMQRAQGLAFTCEPFFVGSSLLARIDTVRKKFFQ